MLPGTAFKSLLPVAALALGLSLPVQAATPFAKAPADIDGRALGADFFKNKVTVIVVANRAGADDATALGGEVRFQLSGEPRFNYAVVLNLRDIPSFAQGIATGAIKDRAKTAEVALKDRFTQASKPNSPVPPTFLPDWDGTLVQGLLAASPLPQFSIFQQDAGRSSRYDRQRQERERQQLMDRIHVFVVGPDGNIAAHLLDAGAAQPTIQSVRGLLKTMQKDATSS